MGTFFITNAILQFTLSCKFEKSPKDKVYGLIGFTLVYLTKLRFIFPCHIVISHIRGSMYSDPSPFTNRWGNLNSKPTPESARCRGKHHCMGGLRLYYFGLDQSKEICCYLYVLKRLNANQSNCRPALQWYPFIERSLQ